MPRFSILDRIKVGAYVSPMGAICDPLRLAKDPFGSNYRACSEGGRDFLQTIDPLTKIRQKIGVSQLKSSKNLSINKLRAELSTAAHLVEDAYALKKETCKKKDNIRDCGFVHAYGKFVKNFGPLGLFENPPSRATSVNLKPLNSGALIADLVPAKMGLEILFDTGGTHIAFSENWVRSHSSHFLPVDFVRPGLPAFIVSGLTFTVGDIPFTPNVGVTAPLIDFLEGSDVRHHLVAVFGMDFLVPKPFEVNYDNSRLILNQNVGKRIKDGRWIAIPARTLSEYFSYQGLLIDVFLNAKPVPMLLDTAKNSSALYEQCLGALPGAKKEGGGSFVAADKLQSFTTLTNIKVKIGSFEMMTSMDLYHEENPEGCGLLGTDVLSHFNILWDPETFTLYFIPIRKRKLSSFKSLGFRPARKEGKITVGSVTEGGAAERAGLKPGDVLLQIDGRNAKLLTPIQIMELAYSKKNDLAAVIEHGGEKKTVVIKRH